MRYFSPYKLGFTLNSKSSLTKDSFTENLESSESRTDDTTKWRKDLWYLTPRNSGPFGKSLSIFTDFFNASRNICAEDCWESLDHMP